MVIRKLCVSTVECGCSICLCFYVGSEF